MFRFPIKKTKYILFIAFIILIVFLLYKNFFNDENDDDKIFKIKPDKVANIPLVQNKISTFNLDLESYFNSSKIQLNFNVHIFYYAWYGNLVLDKKWIHWNHKRLAHWNKGLVDDYSQAEHHPPDDIGSDFYPAMGLYSSRNVTILRQHFKMIQSTGVGVIILSWFAEGKSDPNGIPMNDLVNIILDEADRFHLKVALHMEPYTGRTAATVKKDIQYISKHYGNHSAFFKKSRFKTDKPLPVVYIYDSYLIAENEWLKIFGQRHPDTIRGKFYDVFVVGLLLERDGCNQLAESGFDAGYTYFAGSQVSYSSIDIHWEEINRRCFLKNIEFYPSIGPGYKDASIRPWNDYVTQARGNGKYFVKRFKQAMLSKVRSFGITSFNEWHEGTQIEPAIPHFTPNGRLNYEDYLPNSPLFYLTLTGRLVDSFTSNRDIEL